MYMKNKVEAYAFKGRTVSFLCPEFDVEEPTCMDVLQRSKEKGINA